MTQTATIQRTSFASGAFALPTHDTLVVEEPLEIRLNGEALSVTMRTPGSDFDLVRGFLFTEQIVRGPEDIFQLTVVAPNVVSATVPKEILEGKCWVRNFYASSSCGVCGKSSIEQLHQTRPIVKSGFRMRAETFGAIPKKMRGKQAIFDQTGGLHAAALFNAEGEILCLKEDIGRHNAVDKVVGWMMTSSTTSPQNLGLFVSGRTSFEIIQKGVAAGVAVIGAISAPSSLAVSLAEEYGVTLAGFVRDGTFSVYSHPERIHA